MIPVDIRYKGLHARRRSGRVLILTRLTKETGGEFYTDGPLEYNYNWVWYAEDEGFKPKSGNWWSDGVFIRENLEFIKCTNPFEKFCRGVTESG